jgi:imidazolonepropionase
MKVFHEISELITLENAFKKDGRKLSEVDLSILKNASIVADEKIIHWVGESFALPKEFNHLKKIDCKNFTILPSWVDAHTHIVFHGNRSHEYTLRLNGASYEEIAKAGGGIAFTVEQTRHQSFDELFDSANKRIQKMYAQGVSTLEIKSGYGLNFESEEKISRVIDACKKHWAPKIKILNTFMAAHAKPKEVTTTHEYLKEVVVPLLEKLSCEKILDAVDIFHEKNYFTDNDVEVLFHKAHELNIPVKMHADELNDNSGAKIACQHNALSCDHLLKINDEGINSLAHSKTVAVLLPGTGFFLGKNQANARKLLDEGAKVAIASDFNPGSCHFDNVFKIAQFVAPTYKMNRAELIAGLTLNASHALGLHNQGVIKTGMESNFSLFNCKNLDELLYFWSEDLFFKYGFDLI